MFKENRQIGQQPDTGKTDIGRALKGVVTHNPEDTAVGFMGGEPSPPAKLIEASREIQQKDPEGIIAKVKRNVITILKTPTTMAKSVLEGGHGAVKWTTLQINKAVQQVINLGAVGLAVPVKIWEVGTSPVKKVIKGITDATHSAVDKVVGLLPSNPPRQGMAPAPA